MNKWPGNDDSSAKNKSYDSARR